MRKLLTVIVIIFCANQASSEPIYRSSVTSNDLEFISSDDPSAFSCLSYEGRNRAEMPDKRGGELFADGVFTYTSRFKDGTSVGIWVHPDIGSQVEAAQFANHAAQAVGKLPSIMRSQLDHVIIHKGEETAFAEEKGRFFVLYSENMAMRIQKHDLEETVFHESVHATLDFPLTTSQTWIQAQIADSDFITNYAKHSPTKEDMAESALFAWAILINPGRLPKEVEQQVRSIIPNRLKFFEDTFVNSGPVFQQISPAASCD